MNYGFKHVKKDNLEYLVIPAFEDTGLVKHCFTTRKGGVSQGEAASLNLGFKRKDTKENVLKNFEIICKAIDVDDRKLVLSNQVHSDKIYLAKSSDLGKGIYKESDIIGYDGLMTKERGVPLCTFYADCVPLFFLDTRLKIIASVHSGWRSTFMEIGAKTVRMMVQKGSEPKDILAAVGPSIGQCHFEVGEDVAQDFAGKFGQEYVDGRYVDLWKINTDMLKGKGIPDENITVAQECTYCKNDLYYSYRGDSGKTGSLAAIMELR